jgi:hypothetical protein
MVNQNENWLKTLAEPTQINTLDYDILKASIRHHIRSAGGLLSLPTDEVIDIVRIVTQEIKNEAEQYSSFQVYFRETDDI